MNKNQTIVNKKQIIAMLKKLEDEFVTIIQPVGKGGTSISTYGPLYTSELGYKVISFPHSAVQINFDLQAVKQIQIINDGFYENFFIHLE